MAVDKFRLEKEEKPLVSGKIRAVKAKNLSSFRMGCRQLKKGASGHYMAVAVPGHSNAGKVSPGLLIWGQGRRREPKTRFHKICTECK